jgi:hypothetical protein
MKQVIALALTLVMSIGAVAAPAPQASAAGTTKKKSMKKAAASTPSVTTQLSEMKQAIDAQQQQIQQLMQQLQSREQAIQQLQQRLDQGQTATTEARSKAEVAASQASQQQQAVSDLKSDVNNLKQNSTNTALTLQETQKSISALESPLAIHYKGITITPGGFLAAETVWRQHGLASDINTPFNSIPYPGAAQNRLSEFFGSGRQSRVSMLAEGKLKEAKLSGYVEGDFLSAGTTSNNNQSNSYSFRQRQAWGQAAIHGWSFTGGQMWTLLTETKKGVDNRTEALPMTIDPQYTVGFSWARQYGFRVAKDLHDKLWLAFSVENPQATVTSHGTSSNFVIGAAGTSGGLYNPSATYSFNPSPDFIGKAVFEPGFGHYEIFGVVSQFRDRIYPCATAATGVLCGGVSGPSAALATNASTTGGGVGANARVSLLKKRVDLGVHFLGGNGIGRYGTAGLADATVRPDGTLALLRSYQALGTLEWHSPKIDIYVNGGGEYVGRNAVLNSSGKGVGYGDPTFSNSGCTVETVPETSVSGSFPGSSGGFLPGSLSSCTGDTRAVIEGTFGFWYKLYNGPKGRLQFGPQYSYVTRNAWSGTPGEPHGIENMVLTSFRYYLP